MKKIIAIIIILCIGLVLFFSGCTQQEDNGNDSETTGNTVTMTAKEFFNDMEMKGDGQTSIIIDYKSLEDGDTLILHDTINETTYDSDNDTTTIKFGWTNGGASTSLNVAFQGNLTGSYTVGDTVNITQTIKQVTFSYQNAAWDMEIFEGQWEDADYFTSHITTGTPYKPLPASCIVKV